MISIGIDPGLSTGYAIFEGTELIKNGVIHNGLTGFLAWWDDSIGRYVDSLEPSLIVCERYVPLEGFRGLDQTHSLEIQGAIRSIVERELGDHVQLALQMRQDKALLFGQDGATGDDGEAARIEWFEERGVEFLAKHDMDAATHVLVNRKKSRDMDFWRAWWARNE